MKRSRYITKISFVAFLLTGLSISGIANAAVVQLAEYRLGEPGSVSLPFPNTSPYFIDSIGTPNNVTANQVAVATVDTVNFAPTNSSTASIDKTSGGVSGFFANSNPFGLGTNYAMDVWVRPAVLSGNQEILATDNGTGLAIGLSGANWTVFNITAGVRSTLISTTTTGSIGAWTRMTLINYNGTAHFYADETSIGSAATPARTLDQPMFFFGPGGLNPYVGNLDEAAMWSFDHNADSLTDVENAVFGIVPPTAPEPSTLVLALLSVVGLAFRRGRRR